MVVFCYRTQKLRSRQDCIESDTQENKLKQNTKSSAIYLSDLHLQNTNVEESSQIQTGRQIVISETG
jgi:hypothetical protein